MDIELTDFKERGSTYKTFYTHRVLILPPPPTQLPASRRGGGYRMAWSWDCRDKGQRAREARLGCHL